MADKYLNQTGLNYYHNRIKTIFADKTAFDTLSDKVDEIIAEGGEPNVIETVKVNNVALVPVEKAVNIDLSTYALKTELPTKTSDLTNDGDGQSNFATETYVDTYGGKIDVIQVNSVPQTITNKTVNIDLSAYALAEDVPTATSDLTNDSDFQNETEVQALIDASLADITGIDFQVVNALPATGEHGVIYLVPNGGQASDIYDEYIWVTPTSGTARFEKIGTTAIDLSDYWSKTELVAITTAEIDTLFS